MSLCSSTCDAVGNCDTPFFVNLYSTFSNSYNKVTFSGRPFFSKSSNFHEPCVSSQRVASPKSQEEWFCETCDCFVQYNNANHFSDIDFKHCRLFFAECQSVGVFKNAPVGQYLLFNANNACCNHSEFLSTFTKYEIDPKPFEHRSFSNVYRGICLQSSQHVIVKVFNQHSTATSIYEEYILLKSFRYIMLIAYCMQIVARNVDVLVAKSSAYTFCNSSNRDQEKGLPCALSLLYYKCCLAIIMPQYGTAMEEDMQLLFRNDLLHNALVFF